MISKTKLTQSGTCSFGTHAPWVSVPTFAAANFLKVHEKTLLKWHHLGVGPEPEPRDKYTQNQLYWVPAKLLAWWEAQTSDRPRTEDQIIAEWKIKVFWWEDYEWPMPPKPKGRHLRRRRRIARSNSRRDSLRAI
jgi:hypothetical protein